MLTKTSSLSSPDQSLKQETEPQSLSNAWNYTELFVTRIWKLSDSPLIDSGRNIVKYFTLIPQEHASLYGAARAYFRIWPPPPALASSLMCLKHEFDFNVFFSVAISGSAVRGPYPLAWARPVRYIFLIFSFYTIFEVFVKADLVPGACSTR